MSNVRWATDATYIWTRWDGLIYLNAILDCADRECIGFNVSQRNDAIEAAWALEDALINRFGALPTADIGVMLLTDIALVYASKLYRKLAKSYGLPTALLPRGGISWTSLPGNAARVTLADGRTTVSCDVNFGERGEIVRISAMRYRESDGKSGLTPWVWALGRLSPIQRDDDPNVG